MSQLNLILVKEGVRYMRILFILNEIEINIK